MGGVFVTPCQSLVHGLLYVGASGAIPAERGNGAVKPGLSFYGVGAPKSGISQRGIEVAVVLFVRDAKLVNEGVCALEHISALLLTLLFLPVLIADPGSVVAELIGGHRVERGLLDYGVLLFEVLGHANGWQSHPKMARIATDPFEKAVYVACVEGGRAYGGRVSGGEGVGTRGGSDQREPHEDD